MRILRGKLERYQATQQEEERQVLRGERTEAAWGNHIRSYVLHPYRQVREHRSEYEESDPDAVLGGKLDGFIEHYLRAKASL
jgi:peptide chain release factor 2